MTTKNALKIIDSVIQKKSQLKSDFLNLEMPWNQGEGKIPEFSQQLAQVMARDVEILTQIKNEYNQTVSIQRKCEIGLLMVNGIA